MNGIFSSTASIVRGQFWEGWIILWAAEVGLSARHVRSWWDLAESWMRPCRVRMRPGRVWMRLSRLWMRPSRMWMRPSRVCGWDLAGWLERLAANEVATVLVSIPASSDTVESEGRQMKQFWIQHRKKKKNPWNPCLKRPLLSARISTWCLCSVHS
jgi:hypothetical protein